MNQLISQSFASLEEFVAFPHGWDVDFRPISRQHGPVTLHHTCGQNLMINIGELSGSTLQRGVTPKGMRTFALALGNGPDFLWQGRKVSSRELMVFNPSGDLQAVTQPGTSICTFSIDNAYIAEYLARQDCGEDPLPQESLVVTLAEESTDKLLRDMSQFNRGITLSRNHQQAHNLSLLLEESLSDTLLGNLMARHTAINCVAPDRAAQVTSKAVAYIESHKRQLLRVSQICAALGVGQRTLELSFKKHLGISPKQFLKSMRLLGCQQQLLEADPEYCCVNQIAADWGYWHMSQFARDYQLTYGELPSHTLRRSKTSPVPSPL